MPRVIIDGYHRLNVNPKWPRKKVEEVRDPVQLAIARLIANVCRRTVSAEEKTEWLRQIAQLTGWTPKQIAANLPVSYQWVMKYLPDEFKDKEMKELALRRRAEEKHFIPCARCGVAVSMPIYLEGQFYCEPCARKIELEEKGQPEGPAGFDGEGRIYHHGCLMAAQDEQWRCLNCWLIFDATEMAFDVLTDRIAPLCPSCGSANLKRLRRFG